MADGYTVAIMKGLAALINDAGLGVYRETGAYTEAERGIFFDNRGEKKGQSLLISPYMAQSNALAIENTRIQFRVLVGTDPTEGRNFADDLRGLLHYRTHVELGGHHIDLIRQWSVSGPFPDKNGRLEYSQNFIFRGNRYA